MTLKESFTKQRNLGRTGTFIASFIIGTWIAIGYILPIFDFNKISFLARIDLIIGVATGILFAIAVVKLVKKGGT